MRVHAFVQCARPRYALLLAGILAVSIVLAAVILFGPKPAERDVDSNPFSNATYETAVDALPKLALVRPNGNGASSASAGPRAELDTATSYAPQAPVAVAPRSIQLLGAEGWDAV